MENQDKLKGKKRNLDAILNMGGNTMDKYNPSAIEEKRQNHDHVEEEDDTIPEAKNESSPNGEVGLEWYFTDSRKFKNQQKENVPLFYDNIARLRTAIQAYSTIHSSKATGQVLLNNIVDKFFTDHKDELDKLLKQMAKKGF